MNERQPSCVQKANYSPHLLYFDHTSVRLIGTLENDVEEKCVNNQTYLTDQSNEPPGVKKPRLQFSVLVKREDDDIKETQSKIVGSNQHS